MRKIMTLGKLMVGVVSSLLLVHGVLGQSSGPTQSKPAAKQTGRQLEISNKPWTGDFDQMLERRILRVLVPYSRSLYFNDKGQERGIAAETVRDFERWINKKYAKELGKRPLTIFIIPTTRDKLLPEVAKEIGDIAVGNLTVTEDRLRLVDFASSSDWLAIKELVITGPKSPAIGTIDDLSGKTVHVRKASSYYESLETLNERFKKEGKPIMTMVLVPDALEDEDMMEMLNAGLLEVMIVDDWKARIWAQILPKIKVNEQVAVREGGKIGWAIRKGSKLEAEILGFYQGYLKKGVSLRSVSSNTCRGSNKSRIPPPRLSGSALRRRLLFLKSTDRSITSTLSCLLPRATRSPSLTKRQKVLWVPSGSCRSCQRRAQS